VAFKQIMSTFTLADSSPPCKITLCDGLSEDQLTKHKPFKQWLEGLQQNLKTQSNHDHAFNKAPFQLRSINIQAIDRFGRGRIGFLKFSAEIKNDNGESLPSGVFLRGGSVAMLVR
jgi:hypothetical protein